MRRGLFLSGGCVKPSLSWDAQVTLLAGRGLVIDDEAACAVFLAATNYYRFSGYARYFQVAPDKGDDQFKPGTTFQAIREIHDSDETLRGLLGQPLAVLGHMVSD